MQDTFQWTDDLAFEFASRYPLLTVANKKAIIEAFKANNSPKKEWEIVAYRYLPNGNIISDMGTVGALCAEAGSDDYTIHSVRRLSDGEVFSVGNRIVTSLYKNGVTIKRFELQESRLFVYHDQGHFYADGQHYYFGQVKKLPQFILTTVDGVEIFPGDKFWAIINWEVEPHEAKESDRGWWKKARIYSTEEMAQKYILENKTLLSLNDVKEAWASDRSFVGTDWLLEKLTALVKQKLNQ